MRKRDIQRELSSDGCTAMVATPMRSEISISSSPLGSIALGLESAEHVDAPRWLYHTLFAPFSFPPFCYSYPSRYCTCPVVSDQAFSQRHKGPRQSSTPILSLTHVSKSRYLPSIFDSMHLLLF